MKGRAGLADQVLAGHARGLGRAISVCEARGPKSAELLTEIFPRAGQARVIGVTGAPGAGKSTLVQKLALALRRLDRKVGILAVDPTSPFSGGAILGDRVRMQDLYVDPGVFIRSMATRGALGGLAPATLDAIDVLDAGGFDDVIVETVGVGQDEVDIMRAVDSVLLLLVPGLGDDIQAIKAGVMEIADIFVVNKADRPGAERTASEVQAMLSHASEHGEWVPPIVSAVASTGAGVDEILARLDDHGHFLRSSGEGRRRRRGHLENRFLGLLRDAVFDRVRRELLDEHRLKEIVDGLVERRSDPYAAAHEILARLQVGGESRTGSDQV